MSPAGWQVTLCDPIWHVSSRSGVATLRTAIHLLLAYLHRLCDVTSPDVGYTYEQLNHSNTRSEAMTVNLPARRLFNRQ